MKIKERGASAAEYVLIVTGIAIVALVAVYFFGESVLGLFQDTCEAIDSASADYSCEGP